MMRSKLLLDFEVNHSRMNALGNIRWNEGHSQSLLLLIMTLCMFSLTACENAPRGIPRGEVSGKITFQGAPVTEGTVTFYSDKTGIAAPADLDSNGSFTISNGIEVGSYAVMIAPPIIEDVAGAPPTKKAEKTYDNIPKKYRASETSGLQAEVKKGRNEYVFNME